MLVTGLSKGFGSQALFDSVSFQLAPGQRLAIVGPNGAGKTTLLRIIAGQIDADGGDVVLAKGAHIALHDQRPPLGRDITLGDYVAEGVAEVQQFEGALAAIETRMANGDHGPQTLAEYQRVQEAFERAGGYGWRHWLERVLRGLGIEASELERPLTSFSGGELTRASLARSLVGNPDVLLLDEPTNHLDLDAMVWLEGAVADLAAAIVFVSHDRWFLESTATQVLEIDRGQAKLWPLGYSAFRRERALAMDRQSAEAERQTKEIARLERFVERWSAGTKSRQATSRKKQLERIDRVEAPTRAKSLAFGFPRVEQPARVVIEVDRLEVRAGKDRVLVRDAGFSIERGQRVAIVAPNGAGKTSLLETLIGKRNPHGGRVSVGHKVRFGYFSQHAAELELDRTVIETVLFGSNLTNTQARTLLGSFLFPGSMVEKRVESLSGGERRRLSLVKLIAEGGNVLVLDEPTNHLDIESREALEEAIMAFDGTVIMISHDRALIDLVATHTLAIEDERVVIRNGGYRELVEARAAQVEVVVEAPVKAKPASVKPSAGSPKPQAKGRRQVERLESEITRLETEIAGIEVDLADPSTAGDVARISELGAQYQTLQEELAWKLRDWEEIAEQAG